MFFAGMARAFGSGLEGVRADNARKAEIQNQQENALLQHLITAPDQGIASAALTGLMAKIQGKPSKGLGRFFQDTSKHPAFPTIQSLIAQGRKLPDQQVTAEPAAMEGYQGPPPPETEGGDPNAPSGPAGAPASMAQMYQTQPSARSITLPGPTVPRQLSLTPGQKAYEAERGQYQARADVATGLPEDVRASVFGHTTPLQIFQNKEGDLTGVDRNRGVAAPIPGGAGAGKPQVPPRPTGQEAKLAQRVMALMATDKNLSAKDATQQALVEERRDEEAKRALDASIGAARLESLGASTARAQDQVPITITAADGSTRVDYVTPPKRAGAAPPAPAAAPGAAPKANVAPPAGGGAPAAAPARPGARGGIQTKPPTVTPEQVTYWGDQLIRDPANLKFVIGDKAMMTAIREDLATRGVDLTNLDATTRDMAIGAQDIKKNLPLVRTLAGELNQLGLLGPIGGRWNALVAGTIGAGELAGGNAENAFKIGRFLANVKLLKTGVSKVHVGARGSGQILQEFEDLIGAGWRDAPTFLGSIQGVDDWMTTYADRLPATARGAAAAAEGGGPPPSAGPVQVTDPKGGVHTFPTQAAADAFKRDAKIP